MQILEVKTIVGARQLANYIKNSREVTIISPLECPYNDHVGALFTDIILQSGLNYRTVVAPRVNNVLKTYPNAYSVEKFLTVIETYGTNIVLRWNDSVKLNRMRNLIKFCQFYRLNYTNDIKKFLLSLSNRTEFLKIKGIGKKTLDYLMKLLNIDTVAVDRHIFKFVEMAGIESKDYAFVKSVVEYAADIMDVSRRSIDYSIWSFMASRGINKHLSLNI